MNHTEIIAAVLMLWTVIEAYAIIKIQRWWTELHATPPPAEMVQGSAVDRVLFHWGNGGEWSASTAWCEGGRGMMVALIRQGFGCTLCEGKVDRYRPVFELGYALGEEGREKAVDALRKQVERRDERISDLREECAAIAEQLDEERNRANEFEYTANTNRRYAALCQSLRAQLEEAQRSAPVPAPEVEAPAPVPEPVTEPEAVSEPLTAENRDAEILRLHEEGISYGELAKRFGFKSRGGVQGACERARRRRAEQEAQGASVPYLRVLGAEDSAEPLLDASSG